MATLKVPVTDEDHIQGSVRAPIVLVEYSDYQCRYCAMVYPIVKAIQEHFGQRLCFVFRNFPLSEKHSYAEPAAETAEFAAKHNCFWEMHDLIYVSNQNLDISQLLECARKLNLPVDELKLAIENRTFESKIQSDFLGGVRSGVNGTPTFFINNQRYDGPIDLKGFIYGINFMTASISDKA